eukprot:COSAG01_NODE_12916_length_1664_cov_0.948882_2_plen_299_part_00
MCACARACGAAAQAGGLEATELEAALAAALPFHVPFAASTGEPLGVEYSLQYHVSHLPSNDLALYERQAKLLLTEELARQRGEGGASAGVGGNGTAGTGRPGGGGGGGRGTSVLDLEVKDELEQLLDGVFHRAFNGAATYNPEPGPSADAEPYALIFLNPRLDAMRPDQLSGGGESFLRVHWVAVPKALRARRVNRRRTRRRRPGGRRRVPLPLPLRRLALRPELGGGAALRGGGPRRRPLPRPRGGVERGSLPAIAHHAIAPPPPFTPRHPPIPPPAPSCPLPAFPVSWAGYGCGGR